MFEKSSDTDIKLWLSKNRVLFVTNSTCLPGSTLLASMKTYIDYIPVHNFRLIPGLEAGKPCYGLRAFYRMCAEALTADNPVSNFDYAVYIDEDCFITDFISLVEMLADFISGDKYCLSGPQDGGVLCHRNHRHNLVNTFLSFWNLKLLRKFGTLSDLTEYCQKFSSPETGYSDFVEYMRSVPELSNVLREMNAIADMSLDTASAYRRHHFGKQGESPYAAIVRNDPDNPTEASQIPYSREDSSGGIHSGNFEPYYAIEEALVAITGKPILYMRAADSYTPDLPDTAPDNSGLTTKIMYEHYNIAGERDFRTVALHTWFSRAYTKWPKNAIQKKHTERINSILLEYARL